MQQPCVCIVRTRCSFYFSQQPSMLLDNVHGLVCMEVDFLNIYKLSSYHVVRVQCFEILATQEVAFFC